jgi:hypothetical protein
MKRCTFCETELDDRSLRDGRCVACGLDLDWKEAESDERDTHWVTALTGVAKESSEGNVDGSAKLRDSRAAGVIRASAPAGAAEPQVPSAIEDKPLAKRPTIPRGPAGTVAAFSLVEAAFKDAGDDSTLHGRRVTSTIDAASMPVVSNEKIAGIWESTLLPGIGPLTTIRREDKAPDAPNARLVIKPRAIQQQVDGEIKAGADYELREVIGEGGVGVVYAARQASIDRTVAVKMLRPTNASKRDQREKFLSEAAVTGDLDHPNIVPIYDLGTNENGALFYSMKRVQGTPWMNVMERKSLAENLEILLKVADAIGFAHSRGIIHRDLKPENVMLGEYG